MLFSELLTRQAVEFGRIGLPFAIGGGVALAAHGIQRTTADLDLVVPGERAEDAIEILRQQGFALMRRSLGFSNHVRTRSAGGDRIDLLYVRAETRDEIFERAIRVSIEDVQVLVVHPDHLVAMKLFATSQNPSRAALDLEDVRLLLAAGKVDRSVVAGYLERYNLVAMARASGFDV